jgi:two-component system, chemotaxis family, chemotaxis protein CheY
MKTVMLVDDDNTVLLATGVRLKSMGYIVYTAKDAVSAVSAVRKNNPDVVVLDISLPAGDGFTVAERLQTLTGSAATPIIFITSSEDTKLREQARKMGAVGFLTKPFDATQLADAIETALYPGQNWQPQLRSG